MVASEEIKKLKVQVRHTNVDRALSCGSCVRCLRKESLQCCDHHGVNVARS